MSFKIIFIDFERERAIFVVPLIYAFIVCALTEDQTRNLGILG